MKDNLTLIKLVKEGNEGAWCDLVKKYSQLIWSVTSKYSLFNNKEDICQDVFKRLLDGGIDKYDPQKASISTYIITLTTWICIDILRKNKTTFAPVPLTQETNIENHQKIDIMETEIEKLSSEQKLIIKLKYFHKKSYSEIAKIMDRDYHFVKNTLFNARKHLKKKLIKKFED